MEDFIDILREISAKSRFCQTSQYVQHGSTSCMLHMIAVAYYSIKLARLLARFLNIKCRERELVRSALLHDYFLYDWHDKDDSRHLIHGFTHPGAALMNAEHDFSLTEIEKNSIKRHMFPLTILPPAYMEGWIICLVDKYCSSREVLERNPYAGIVRMLEKNNIYSG